MRLDLLRQIAEVVRFAHEKKVVHRGLCPQSILVTRPGRRRAAGQALQLAGRLPGRRPSTAGVSRASRPPRTSTSWSRTPSTAYMAPEAVSEDGNPASTSTSSRSGPRLPRLLRRAAGGQRPGTEQEAARHPGAADQRRPERGRRRSLQDLVQFSTHPDVASRIDSAADFLSYLDARRGRADRPGASTYVDGPARGPEGRPAARAASP